MSQMCWCEVLRMFIVLSSSVWCGYLLFFITACLGYQILSRPDVGKLFARSRRFERRGWQDDDGIPQQTIAMAHRTDGQHSHRQEDSPPDERDSRREATHQDCLPYGHRPSQVSNDEDVTRTTARDTQGHSLHGHAWGL